MNTVHVGEEAVNSVEVCSLTEILEDVRQSYSHYDDSKTGIPAIDQLLAAKVAHASSSAQGHSCPVVELISTSPAAGKTHLIYYAIALATCSSTTNDRIQKAGCVVVLDADNRFSVVRLAQVMKDLLTKSISAASDAEGKPKMQEVESLVHQALEHVYIFSPQSLQNMVSILQDLPVYLSTSSQARHSGNRILRLVIIDSISAFFWQATYSTEMTDEENADLVQTSEASKARQALYAELVASLKGLQHHFRCSVLATNCSLSPSKFAPEEPQQFPGASTFRSMLPSVWTSFTTLRLGVAREQVTRFPHGMSAGQAKQDRPVRLKVVQEGKFVAWVDAESRDLRNRSFGFRIYPKGVSLGS